MRNILSLYGKNIAGVTAVLILVLTAGAALKAEWQQSGIAKNPRQKQFAAGGLSWEKPALDTTDKRFFAGENILVSELAAARDFDGTDLTGEIHYYEETGRGITGQWRKETPGIYRVQAVVRSPVTKRENKKTMIILIDGGERR